MSEPKKRSIYIAGKVSGLPFDEVVEKFAAYAASIREDSVIVNNPVALVQQANKQFPDDPLDGWEKPMKFCLSVLMSCDEIHMLPDWRESRGATLEHFNAKALGYKIVYVPEPPLKYMPVNLDYYQRKVYKDFPRHVPIALLNEEHAQKLFKQSLQELAKQGGLAPRQIIGNIKGLSSSEQRTYDDGKAIKEILELLQHG